MLDYTSLRKSLNSLEESLHVLEELADNDDTPVYRAVRAGVVQTFEVSYELSWKFIQRWIQENRGDIDAGDYRSKKDLFRMAVNLGVISSAEAWFQFLELRNLSSHTYDEGRAAEVCKNAASFLQCARELLTQLEARND